MNAEEKSKQRKEEVFRQLSDTDARPVTMRADDGEQEEEEMILKNLFKLVIVFATGVTTELSQLTADPFYLPACLSDVEADLTSRRRVPVTARIVQLSSARAESSHRRTVGFQCESS